MYTVDRENALRRALDEASDEDLGSIRAALEAARFISFGNMYRDEDQVRAEVNRHIARISSLFLEVQRLIDERFEPDEEDDEDGGDGPFGLRLAPSAEGAFKEALVNERLRDEYGESDV